MIAAARLAVGARRALPRRAGGAVELGSPASWPASELQRVHVEARRLATARARRQLPGVAGLATAFATVSAALGVDLLEVVACVVLGLAAWGLRSAWSEQPVVARWRAWAAGRTVLERELRLLGAEWRLLWDRRLHGVPTPAIIAVGPSGAWALWWPEPGLEAHADPEVAANGLAELSGLPAGAYVLRGSARQWVHELACAPRVASRDDVACAAERLHSMLLQEPVGVGL
jgi:hypothetical protein